MGSRGILQLREEYLHGQSLVGRESLAVEERGGRGRGLEGSAVERIPPSTLHPHLSQRSSHTPLSHQRLPQNTWRSRPIAALYSWVVGVSFPSTHKTVLQLTSRERAGLEREWGPGPGWCFTGILLEGRNEKRRKQSCLRYIYTIGCKSFLMGSRVQSWGTDYQGNLDMAWPAFGPAAPSALHRGSGWSYG